MKWLNLSVTALGEGAFAEAEYEDLGIWLRITAYCALHENGGMIRDCKGWSDRTWIRTVGVCKSDVERQSKLWWWKDEISSLIVSNYPQEQEDKLRAQRKGGKQGAKRRWKPQKITPVIGNPLANPLANLMRNSNGNGKGNPKGVQVAHGSPIKEIQDPEKSPFEE